MYGIISEKDLFIQDNMKDPSGEPRKGIIVFKKKSNALIEAEQLNELRKNMKSKQCYSVQKITPEDVPACGMILDGVWKEKL
jgi:hypothetical protein